MQVWNHRGAGTETSGAQAETGTGRKLGATSGASGAGGEQGGLGAEGTSGRSLETERIHCVRSEVSLSYLSTFAVSFEALE